MAFSGNVNVALRRDPAFLNRLVNSVIPPNGLNHASKGDFTINPQTGAVSRMKGGGHGQENIDYLNSIGMQFNVVSTYSNGVRIGNVPLHKTVSKRTGSNQAWFPSTWSVTDVENAGKVIESMPLNINLTDGVVGYGNYKGVRVGIIKTNGNVGTIFPDAYSQP